MNFAALFLFGNAFVPSALGWMPQTYTNFGVAERPGMNISPNFPISTRDTWSPRQQGEHWDTNYYRRNSMYHWERSEKYVSGNAREYFPTDAMAASTEIFLQSMHGRPLEADVEVFDGPDNTPVRFKVYSENGRTTPVRAIVGMNADAWDRRQDPTVSVRNTATLEFPLLARVVPNVMARPMVPRRKEMGTEIHGDSLRTWSLDPRTRTYGSAAVVTLSSPSGTPVQADIQLWGVSNHILQKIRIHQQDGLRYPTSIVVDTSAASVVAVKNIGPMTFPIVAAVEPFYDERRTRNHDSYYDWNARTYDARARGGLDYARNRNSPSGYARRVPSTHYAPGVDYSNGRNRKYASFSSDYVPMGMYN